MDYKVILTNIGKAKVAAAIANSGTIKLKRIAFGDGNGSVYVPIATATALKKQKYITDLNSVAIHPDNDNWIVCEGYIPTSVGDFWIREIGVYDEDGDLIILANYPETFKPLLTVGIGTDLKIRIVAEVSDASVVNLTIDPSLILADQEWVMEQIKKNPSGTYIGMLSSCARRDLPAGWVRLDGATYTQETFPQFYEQIASKFPTCTAAEYNNYLSTQGGSCGFFVLNTSAKTFRVPTITDGAALTQALNTTELAKFYGAAIQNITGTFGIDDRGLFVPPTGAFYNAGYTNDTGSSGSSNGNRIGFNASLVVPTAPETRTRQVRYPYIMYIANAGEKEVSEVVWNGFLSALANKANADLSNIPASIDYIVESYNTQDFTGGYRKYKSGLIEQWGRASANATVTLYTPMRDTSYLAIASGTAWESSSNRETDVAVSPNTATTIVVSSRGNIGTHINWLVRGY
jgi:hypothetical protein